jgi:tetratricopeptide (TPR) repeat protein
MYAALALQHNAPLEAIPDFQKELQLHPNETNLYPLLIDTQRRLEMRTEATATLRAWAAADPTDPSPPSQLMTMLIDDGDAPAAVALGQAALPKLAEDPKTQEAFRLKLGDALIAAGKKSEGKAMLEAILKESDNPLSLNDAAYGLADAALDLPLAESSTRTALSKLAEESSAWTLDEDPQKLRAQTNLIVATWDTMGWILFREGKLVDAQSFLAAAWQSGQSADTAEHLGEVAAARGNKTAAMAYYELAESKMDTYDSMGVRRPPGPKQKAVTARIDALHKAGIPSTVGTADDPHHKLQTMRTINVGSADGRTGNAEYRVLIKAGRVVKSEPFGPKEIDRADTLFARANLDKLFPDRTPIALVRFAYLNCHSGICELILQP